MPSRYPTREELADGWWRDAAIAWVKDANRLEAENAALQAEVKRLKTELAETYRVLGITEQATPPACEGLGPEQAAALSASRLDGDRGECVSARGCYSYAAPGAQPAKPSNWDAQCQRWATDFAIVEQRAEQAERERDEAWGLLGEWREWYSRGQPMNDNTFDNKILDLLDKGERRDRPSDDSDQCVRADVQPNDSGAMPMPLGVSEPRQAGAGGSGQVEMQDSHQAVAPPPPAREQGLLELIRLGQQKANAANWRAALKNQSPLSNEELLSFILAEVQPSWNEMRTELAALRQKVADGEAAVHLVECLESGQMYGITRTDKCWRARMPVKMEHTAVGWFERHFTSLREAIDAARNAGGESRG